MKTDIMFYVKNFTGKNSALNTLETMEYICPNTDKKPPFLALNTTMAVQLWVADPNTVQKIYTDFNRFYSKYQIYPDLFQFYTPNGIFMTATTEEYKQRKKFLSKCFFESKMPAINQMIKEVTLEYLRDTQDDTEIDVTIFMTKLQANVIEAISVGRATRDILIPFENEDGTIEEVRLNKHVGLLFKDCYARFMQPHI